MYSRNSAHNQHNQHIGKKYNFPMTKKEDIFCPSCNKAFDLKDRYRVISSSAPLLLSCGHPICSLCAIKQRQIVCKICNESHEYGESGPDKLPPVNSYVIGLLRSLETRNVVTVTEKKELEFSFQPAFESRLEKKFQGYCKDCNSAATCKCNQCDNNLFCETCYMRIHRTALESHQKVNLIDGQTVPTIQYCENHDSYLDYYCVECDIDSCSHCFLRGNVVTHEKSHQLVPLTEKNLQYLEEFNMATQEAARAELRMNESMKMLEEYKTTPEGFEMTENEISQHFIYLHGLLQNSETMMLRRLHLQKEELEENIEDLKKELEEYRAPLQEALMIAKVISETNVEKVNFKAMIDRLKMLANVPSCVLKKEKGNEIASKFVYDRNFVQALKDHCRLDLFDIEEYELVHEDEVSPDYKRPELMIGNKIQIPTTSNGLSKLEVETGETSPPSPTSSSEECDSSSFKDEDLESTTDMSPGSSNGFTKVDMEVKVLHIENPSTFYVVEKENWEEHVQTQNMVKKLGKKSRGKLSEAEIDKNTRCIAKSHDHWHRARVLQVSTNHNLEKIVKVFLIDNGKKLELPISSIKKMTPQLEGRKSFLLEAGLKDIEPVNGSWTEEARQYMINTLKQPGVNMLSIEHAEGPKLIGDIKHMPKDGSAPNCIRQDLFFIGYGSWIRGDRLQRTNPNSYVRKLFHESMALDNYTPVTLSVAENASTMYVHKADPINREFLQSLTLQLAKECNTTDKSMQLRLAEIETGMLCTLPGGPGGEWARGRILALEGKKMVTVFLVDYGITRKVKFDSVRRLPAKHMESQTQAIRVEIVGVKPISDKLSAKATNYMSSHLKNEEFSVVAVEKLENKLETNENNCYLGIVYLQNNEVLLGQLLARKGYVSYEGPVAPLKNLLEKYPDDDSGSNQQISQPCLTNGKSNISSMKIAKKGAKGEKKTEQKEPKQKKDDPFKLEVRIIRAESPDCIYVSDISRQTEFDNLKHEMYEYYKDKQSIREDPYEVGDNVAVYSPKDKTYLRGKVVDVLSTEKVVVYLYDLAITEELDMDFLHDLQKPFDDLPMHAVRVKLAGISPCGGKDVWLDTSKDKLTKKILENLKNRFFINKCGDTEGKAIPVELTVQQSSIIDPLLPTKIEFEDIGKYLVDLGLALPVKGAEKNQVKTLAIELKKELIMYQPNLTESNLKWQRSQPVQQVSQSDDSDDDKEEEEKKSDDEENKPVYSMYNIPLAQKTDKWIPACEIAHDEFEAIPTNIDYDGNVYFHCIEQEPTLETIKSVTAKKFKNVIHESCDEVWEIDDICMARYVHDQAWYRGIIVGKKNDFYYDVYFIDYGNTETTRTEDLKKRIILLEMPAQATSCKVFGLIPEAGKFKTTELDKIHHITVNNINRFTVHERQNNTMICSIFLLRFEKNLVDYLVDDMNIKLKMINGKHDQHEQNGKSSSSSPSSLNSSFASNEDGQKSDYDDDSSVVIEKYDYPQKATVDYSETDDDTSDSEPMLEYKQLELRPLLKDTDTLQLEITIINTCTNFEAHLMENKHAKKLSQFFKEYSAIAKEWEEKAQFQPPLKNIRVGQPCCAKFTDDKWYRAQIINVSDDQNEVEVRYVDYGNKSVCGIENLRNIDVKWLEVPALAVNCELWNICKGEKEIDDDVLTNKLHDLLENRVLYAKVKKPSGNKIKAELYTERKCINLVYSSLIKKGIFRYYFYNDESS